MRVRSIAAGSGLNICPCDQFVTDLNAMANAGRPESDLFKHHLGNRVFRGVRDRKMRRRGSSLFIQFAGASVKQNHRRA